MSCEDDDYGWDDPEPVIEVRKINVEVNTISLEELNLIEEAMLICLDRKFDKLNILLKQMNVYHLNGNLIVNDRYNTALNFINTVSAFGMDIKKVDIAGLKGKTYIISDKILSFLEVLGTEYSFGEVNIQKLPASTHIDEKQLFKYDLYDMNFKKYMREIKETGKVTIEGTEALVDNVSTGIESDFENVESQLKSYLTNIKQEVCSNNKELQHGTTEILYERARQMGYSVEKQENGNEVQLVLVRLN